VLLFLAASAWRLAERRTPDPFAAVQMLDWRAPASWPFHPARSQEP
jgi:hypothetical protein